jgi:hypothetical protein
MGLPDSRYRFTVFREVHIWPPILTPGEPPTTELQNADMLGAVWQQIAPTSFWPPRALTAESPGAGQESTVRSVRPGRPCPQPKRLLARTAERTRGQRKDRANFWIRRWRAASAAANKRLKRKRAALIKAPPLKGSDTSVSSPKRQTAEAVRASGSRKRRVESSGILRGCYQHPA